jgi:hypothetical protein
MKSSPVVCRWVSAFLLGTIFVLPQAVHADAIPGLFNTGVAGIGVADSHYALTASPSGGGTVWGISRNASWVSAPVWSSWIGISEGNVTDPEGLYTYDLQFGLTGLLSSTAVVTGNWAMDNSAEIFLNGVTTGETSSGVASLAPFTINSGFQSGLNTLSFHVTNAPPTGVNPTGLLVTNLAGTARATVVPVPGAIWMGLGLIGMIFMRRTFPRSFRAA